MDVRINRTIWIYWHQGWDVAPPIAEKCLSTWKRHNPGWNVVPLSAANVGRYVDEPETIPGWDRKTISLTGRSDILRISLLKRHGGVWVDATAYCHRPLDDWLPAFYPYDFWAFSKPADDRLIASWFLFAATNSYIAAAWYRATIAFWTEHDSTDRYFWFHELFNRLYADDPIVKEQWDRAPDVLARGAHAFFPYTEKLCRPADRDFVEAFRRVNTPVFKLSYKCKAPTDVTGSRLAFLLANTSTGPRKRVLIAWYGSFEKSGTLGDYLSVKALTERFREHGIDCDCLCYKHFDGLPANVILPPDLRPGQYAALVFCCGPMMKKHPHLPAFFEQFQGVHKIGIGVSLFPKNHMNYFNPFDRVFAREHADVTFGDIAVLASRSAVSHSRSMGATAPTIGMVLCHPQNEYGPERCRHKETVQLLTRLAGSMDGGHHTPLQRLFRSRAESPVIVHIDNHLESSGLTPDQIEEQYARCDLILTSRFHGTMVALRNDIPVIAVDQIAHGAKVYALVSATGYPYVWTVDDARYRHLKRAARRLLEYDDPHVSSARSRAIASADSALDACVRHLLTTLNQDEPARFDGPHAPDSTQAGAVPPID